MKQEISKATLRFRHLFVKLITPRLYQQRKAVNPLPRGMIKAVKKRFHNKPLIGVEIGVCKGVHAESILKTLNIQKLWLIDPYESYGTCDSAFSTKELIQFFLEAKDRLKPYKNRIVWIKKKSEDAINDIPNELDFIYIDGNHDYPFVKKDIERYYPKVKNGGFLGGHDFSMRRKGVVKAVIEFTAKNSLQLHGDSPYDWWIMHV